jgi:hypothetical protein
MDADCFDPFLRFLSASPSRRSALCRLAGLVLGSPLALGVAGTDAHNALEKCKKIEGKSKKKCLKKAKRHEAKHAQESTPPTPVPILAYQCPGPREDTVLRISGPDDQERIAQSFTAGQSGSLHQIQFELIKEVGSTGNYVVELLAVAGGVPTNIALAQVTLPNVSVSNGPSMLTATFSGPSLVAGTEYATALRRLGGNEYEIGVRNSNDCAGAAFVTLNGVFTELFPENGLDFVTSVIVLA